MLVGFSYEKRRLKFFILTKMDSGLNIMLLKLRTRFGKQTQLGTEALVEPRNLRIYSARGTACALQLFTSTFKIVVGIITLHNLFIRSK